MLSLKPNRKKTLKKRLLAFVNVEMRGFLHLQPPPLHSQLCWNRIDTCPGLYSLLPLLGNQNASAGLCSSTPQHKAATYRIS